MYIRKQNATDRKRIAVYNITETSSRVLYSFIQFFTVLASHRLETNFTTWIIFLYHHFKDLKEVRFPDRDAFKHLKSKILKHFKNI